MSNGFGERINESIEKFKEKGIAVVSKSDKHAKIYNISNIDYRIEILVNPLKWLGLEFDLLDKNAKLLLSHSINTDLYPIAQPKYFEYAKDIEDEIIRFLDDLMNHKIKIGMFKGKSAMVIPKGNEYFLINKGLFLTKGSYYKKFQDIIYFKETRSI